MRLHHPSPDLQSLQGAYRSNVSRLEQSAERLSQTSSDLGDEIRKMLEAEKEKDRSRDSSLPSSSHRDDAAAEPQLPPRRRSRTSSHANSIVDLNNAARWGGYSPGGFVTSPVGSVHAALPALSRTASGHKATSRLSTQMVEPLQEGRPLDSPLAPSSESLYSQEQQMSRRASQSSFARRYDQIAAQIEEPPLHTAPAPSPIPEDQAEHLDPPVLDSRPSVDTLNGFENVFKDFDGVHFSPDTEEFVEVDEQGNEVRRISARTSSGSLLNAASMLRQPPPRPISYAAPLPGQGMVYYPAPVPRVLNLPKRLSQMPAPSAYAQRRSQMLSEMSSQAQQSAPWLSQSNASDAARGHHPDSETPASPPPQSSSQRRSVLNPRASMAHLSSIPPHLRASMFFEHQPISQDVDIQSESAVATLDSILAASATAPVSVFTDHPYAGDVRKTVYAPEVRHAPKRSSTTLAALTQAEAKPTKRRSGSIGRLFRKPSTDLDEAARRSRSRSSTLMMGNENGRTLARRQSQLSLGDELERPGRMVTTPNGETSEPDVTAGLVAHASNAEAADDHATPLGQPQTPRVQHAAAHVMDQIEDDFRNEDAQEDVDDAEPVYAAPTTLLAELQVRKAQQKSRNRTAATAFPNGMHSTLLELDAVEEINRKNRKKQRVTLAWEDPGMHAQEADKGGDDDDVPLGMLFPPKDGHTSRKLGDSRDWHRPMGLMEKRELEDSEPLSSRRNRLHGLPPSRATHAPHSSVQLLEPSDDEAEPAETSGETLGQRSRRLKTKDALDSTISDFAPKDGERPLSTFTDDVLSQFGGLNMKDEGGRDQKSSPKEPATKPSEDETLGQRRARLQREREAAAPLRSSQSLANLLAANPVGSRALGNSKQPAYGSLLHVNAEAQTKHKQDLRNTNIRSSSMMLGAPLVDAHNGGAAHNGPTNSGGLLGKQSSGPAVGGFANGLYNNGSGGVVSAPPLPPMFGVSGTNSYFASPTAAYGMGYNGMMPAQPQAYGVSPQQQQQPQPTMNHSAYAALNGGRMSTMMMAPQTAAPNYSGIMAYGAASGVQQFGYAGGAHTGNMGLGMGMGMGVAGGIDMSSAAAAASMDNQQRAAIDRWRMGIAQ